MVKKLNWNKEYSRSSELDEIKKDGGIKKHIEKLYANGTLRVFNPTKQELLDSLDKLMLHG